MREVEVEISIIDTGLGISKEGTKNLFSDFNKLDENARSNPQGTGLGLSISKKIIEQMGGSVTVKSKVGKGTEFKMSFLSKCQIRESLVDQESIHGFEFSGEDSK